MAQNDEHFGCLDFIFAVFVAICVTFGMMMCIIAPALVEDYEWQEKELCTPDTRIAVWHENDVNNGPYTVQRKSDHNGMWRNSKTFSKLSEAKEFCLR